ncbi:Hypothetical predicted protein [Pelobates cultripes]|uniref:Uncharacterized protein n=1 Tax=Pelobates cultripes TaxID=61616 RepID=A0AAD1R280_PELCU|nr:Hypothetical predicted protein [Pelobates cultripes]
MAKKDVACFWIVLLLCQELRTDPIAEMGPSSGILIQETPGFILTEKRILTRRVFVSLDPKISIEKAYNISSMQLPELQIWYQMHLQRAQDCVRNILEQARKPFVSSTISMSNRPKRFLTAIIVALVCATVGAVVATGMYAANSITVQKLDMEIYTLKQHINDIHQVIQQQRTLLQDVLTIVGDTVVTTNLHSELIAKSTELHQSHDLFKRELFLHDPILFHTLAFLDEVQTGMIELAGERIPLYFVSKDIVHAMLANVDGETIEPMQLNLAFEMGSAIPLLLDPEHVQEGCGVFLDRTVPVPRATDRVRNILEQARKPFVSSSIPMSNRPKRFLTAIIVALVCATVGAVVATGMSPANSITVQKLDMEIYALKQHINDIHQVIQQQRTLLQDVLTIVEDTVVTTNLHSELIAISTELHQSHDLFKHELLFLHDPILFHTLAFLDKVQTGMIELAGGHIPLYFVSKDIVHAMLANVDGETIEPMQLKLAFEMGSAIPLLIDPEHPPPPLQRWVLHLLSCLTLPSTCAHPPPMPAVGLACGAKRDASSRGASRWLRGNL